MKKTLVSLVILFFSAYIAVCGYFFIIQNSILFNPTVLEEGHQFNYDFKFEERWFEVEDEARIHAIHAKTDSSKGLVIYYHGNGGSTDTEVEKFDLLLDAGFDVLYPDYRGFGLTQGKMWNEDDLVGDMQVVYKEMLEEYNEEDIVVLGYSIGSGVAAQVAAVNNPRELILWTPYYSMIDEKNAKYWFLPNFLVRYPLRTDLALQQIEEPITIFYGENDSTFPLERVLKLTEFFDENDEYFILKDQPHEQMFINPVLIKKMKEILREG